MLNLISLKIIWAKELVHSGVIDNFSQQHWQTNRGAISLECGTEKN